MRAVVVRELGGPDAVALADVPEPTGVHPGSAGGRLLVEVHCAGVSFPDLLQSRGEYQLSVPPPFVSGGEVAGVVLDASDESGFAPGDRVAGLVHYGGMAERALAMAQYTVRLPESMTFAQGAALYLNYSTAWFAVHRAHVQPGEKVLVQGAAGGVGSAALDVLRSVGAHAIAAVSSEAKERVAREMGAQEVVRSTGPWLNQVRELTGGHGVEVVLDPVGGDRFTDSLRALDLGGRLVVIGFTGRSIPSVKVNRLLLRNLTVTGIGMEPLDRRFPGSIRKISDAIEKLAADQEVSPLVGRRLPLEQGAEALRILDRREAIGKIIVDVTGGETGDLTGVETADLTGTS
jgi:NADPH2:quinone reductase